MAVMRSTSKYGARVLRAPKYASLWTYSLLRISPPIWSVLTKSGKALYRSNPPQLDDVQQRVVNDVVADGISLVHLDDLFPGQDCLSDLTEHTKQKEAEFETGARKTFLEFLWGETPLIDIENPFVRISLEPKVLDIVNSYMNICSKLVYIELSTTNIMADESSAMGSQRWHRDPGMKRLIKMFLYVTDVDEESGPFSYVMRSNSGGQWRRLYPQKQFGYGGIYPPDGAVDKVVPQDDIKVCTGRAGTLIFCDTTGMHRGGYSVSKSRTMYTSVYASEGDREISKLRYPADFAGQITGLSQVPRYAVEKSKYLQQGT